MVNVAHAMPTLIASFMASLVECVEALTVVLAVGTVRGWKSALGGTLGALLTLVALVLILGRSLALVPLFALQVGIGLLLLLFGLRWLRKAILRASGVIALHNEEQAFAKESAAMRSSAPAGGRHWDQVAFATAYKIVMLEGIEVVFIVIALGSGVGRLVPAALGAAVALGCVVLLGLALHRPLSKIPENTLKFAVGILLSGFGTFWVGEGMGIGWPGQDGSLLALVLGYLFIGSATVFFLQRRTAIDPLASRSAPEARAPLLVRVWVEFVSMFVDDGWLAVGTVTWVALWTFALRLLPMTPVEKALGFTAGLVVILSLSSARGARILRLD